MTYTSTGVRAPWVTEQQTAPARANLEYRATPESFSGVLAFVVWTMASSFPEPVEDGVADMEMSIIRDEVERLIQQTVEERVLDAIRR